MGDEEDEIFGMRGFSILDIEDEVDYEEEEVCRHCPCGHYGPLLLEVLGYCCEDCGHLLLSRMGNN